MFVTSDWTKNISPKFHIDNQILYLNEFRTEKQVSTLKKNTKNIYVYCTCK